MQQAMLLCNGVQTHVMTEGRWVEEGLSQTGSKDLVIVIPGNPGIPSFYSGFIKSLKSRLPSETPVWTVGHAGHVQPPKNLCFMSEDDSDKPVYTLQDQLEHKVAFIKQYVPKDAKLHLVGHSIGSWCILQLLKDPEIAKQVVRCYLLFPTIERMAETPNGKFLTNFVLRAATLIVFLAWIFSFFPVVLQSILIRIFGGFFAGVTNKSIKPVRQLLEPPVLDRVFKLAQDEMVKVRERDDELISNYEDKLWVYYGATDGWTPQNYCTELKAKHPDINAQICKRGFRHAFVLTDEVEVGKMVGDIISETMSNNP
ncbi:GSCOCG00000700001-RA-CDS [Cotesia congregata]|uniref:Lipid droplet-associated hydrolase n=1 Tax=Cotesia congregata TaxID=51543 RepID=A0A8J2HBX9_COTCN|nr:GSCOCG00000700001-RA-CDS [Cotesia congregata]CAG5087135.1 Similar to CG9186: Lipid droplet-associated hydrolase (Drosophila melanogaster) [Cotesia congregata]